MPATEIGVLGGIGGETMTMDTRVEVIIVAAVPTIGTRMAVVVLAVAVAMAGLTVTMATVRRRSAVGKIEIEIAIRKGREEGQGNGPMITTMSTPTTTELVMVTEEIGVADLGVGRAVVMIPIMVKVTVVVRTMILIGAEPGAEVAAGMSEGRRRRHRAAMPAAVVDGASMAMGTASRERMHLE